MKNLILLFLLSPFVLKAQSVVFTPDPDNDPAWFLIDYMSDEFNGISIDEDKWDWQPPWGSYHGTTSKTRACLTTNLDNRRVEGGSLILAATDEPSDCERWDGEPFSFPHTVGAMYSENTIKYGYFKIRMRIPDNVGDPSVTDGFGPNFWMWPLLPFHDNEIGDVVWSEIDFYEFRAKDNLQTFNMHYKQIEGPTTDDLFEWSLRGDALEIASELDDTVMFNSSQWHTFSGYWSPDGVSFFRDGKHLFTTDVLASDLIPMNLVIDINTPATNFNQLEIPETSIFPYEYEIDYIRVYKLGMSCEEEVNDCSFWFSGYDNKVKRNITIGGGGCSNIQPTDTKLFLRATDEILINGNFEVPLGAELTMETNITCYE